MKLTSLIAFLFLFLNVHAQTDKGTLSGKILDENNKPLSYASVTAFTKDSVLVRGSITDADGNYTITNLVPGTYYLLASMLDYAKTKSPTVELKAGEKLALSVISLKKQVSQLKEVGVTYTKPLIETQIDKTVMNVENSALAAGNNALELLEKAPGVTVDKDGNVSLRGKTGVQIMIDGKPTYLSQDQLANLLRSTEGNNIQSIEIMTNPSSKYDASGNSGIINIKMKKNQSFGTNGTVSLGQSVTKYNKTEGSLALNHREKLFNLFANYSYGNREGFGELFVDRALLTGANTTYFSSSSLDKRHNYNHNFKTGIDFFLNKNNTLGFIVNGNDYHGTDHQTGINRIGSSEAVGDSAVVADNNGDSPYTFMTYNTNYKAVLDTSGTEITANLDYTRSTGDATNYYSSRYTNAELIDKRSPFMFSNKTPTVVDIYSAKADFTHPFNKKTKLETGLKSSYVTTDNTLVYDVRQSNGTYVNDPLRSNRFKYMEVISAGYVNLNFELNKNLSVQGGVRLENTHSDGNSITLGTSVTRNYLNLFPTLFLRQKLSKSSVLGLSYSRRIDRPDYGSLNPFVYFIDQYLYAKGNPYLDPQYTNSFEMNYTLKDKYMASLNYKHTAGVMTEVILTDQTNKALYQTNLNLATQNNINLNMNVPLTITKWWKGNNNITIIYNQFKSPNLSGSPFSSDYTSFMINSNQSFTITKTTSAELNGSYMSNSVYGTFILTSNYGIDLGVSQSFKDKKFNLKLGVNDVFNTRPTQRLYSELPNSNWSLRPVWESRAVRLTASWRFGNSNVKSTEKKGGSDAEQSRLGNK